MSNDYNGKKRSELPDSVFGIPQERKYPMPDEKHTRSAIKLFNHVDPKYEEQLAKAVIKNMKKYGIDGSVVGPNNRLRKYLPKDMIKESMDSSLYKYMYTDNDPDIIIQESGYALTWRITPILLKAALSGVDQYDYKYLREKTLPAILKKCKTMDDIKYIRRDAIAAKTQLEILKRNVHAVNTNDEQIMKRLSKSFIKKVKDGKITEKEIDTHIRWLGTEYKKLIDARAKEIRDSMKESYIEEGYFKSDNDIYYNKDKFDSGEINLCFVTGLSGSGKSTMGRNMSSKNIEHYEMDDVICNDNFSDDNLREYGSLISSFFKGAGKSFRLIRDNDKHNDSVFNTHKNYEKEITQAFVKHAISYCKSHKETKYVCDGIWIFMFIKPEQLKDCAVYIKGTSSIKSGYRALKRDIDEDKRNGMTSLQIFKHEFKRVKEDILYARENQKELKSFRSYFEKQSTNESVSSTVSKDHKQKGYISLSSLKKVHITESVINKYKKEYPVLRHVRCKDTNEYICDGYMWFKENDLVCYVGSCQYTDDNTKWIVSLEIIPKYRGYGLSNQILDYCVKNMKCKYLSVNKNNELAKKIYDKYGFRVYHEDNTMYYMTIDKSIKESSILPQDTGISTVIFDLGDVLVSANIQDYLKEDPEIPNEIIDELLKLWFMDKDEIDDTMDLDTYRDIINKRMGVEFSKYIPKLFKYNIECVSAFDYTIPMIKDLKDRGYKVYYLSNWSAWTHELIQQEGKFDFLNLMDGGVFSYDAGFMKPHEEIYKILLNKYKINPEEAIFFDDKLENIEAAKKLGIGGIIFNKHNSNIVYDALGLNSIQEHGTTGGTMVGTNQPDSVYIVNYMQNNVFSGYKEPKQAICKKGFHQMFTTKDGKAIPVDIDDFKETASDIEVYRFKEEPILSYDKIIEAVEYDREFYTLLTGETALSPDIMKYDNRFIQEENFFDELENIKSCTEATITGLTKSEEYPYIKLLGEAVEGRSYNYYRDIDGVFVMNELSGTRSESYDNIEDIPEDIIDLVRIGII